MTAKDVIIRVFIVGDQQHLRKRVGTFLSAFPNSFQVVGETSRGSEAIRLIQKSQRVERPPDILIVLIRAFEQEVISTIEFMHHHLTSLKVVVLTDLTDNNFLDDYFLMKLLRLNIHGCLSHHMPLPDLSQAIRSIYQGYYKLDAVIVRRIFPRFSDYDLLKNPEKEKEKENPDQEAIQEKSVFSQLSSREIDVLQLIAKGANNREIGQKLFITEKTVKNHITRIFKKLDIRNRAQAAIIVREYFRQ